jgi:deazaflavin-dependent oxidoreductase (nitroreductase family)
VDPLTTMERELVDLGKVAHLTTRGRMTGEPRHVVVGFVEEPDGTLLVSADGPDQHWGRNLEADPAVDVEVARRHWAAIADPLDRDDHVRTVRGLILRYGTPSEGLGSGPSFRLRPADEDD